MMEHVRAAPPYFRRVDLSGDMMQPPHVSSALTSSSGSSGSSASTTPSSHASSVSSSVLSQLERLVMDDDDDGERAPEEIPLLWCAVEQTSRVHADLAMMSDTRTATTTTTTTTAMTDSAPQASSSSAEWRESATASMASATHAQFVREVTGLLWGADYPTWMEEQWMRQAGIDDDDEEEEEEEDNDGDDAAVEGAGQDTDHGKTQSNDEARAQVSSSSSSLPPPPSELEEATAALVERPQEQVGHASHSGCTPPLSFASADEEKAHSEPLCVPELAVHHILEGNETTEKEKEVEITSASSLQQENELPPQQEGFVSCVNLLQQALEALQLTLPLNEMLPDNVEASSSFLSSSSASQRPTTTITTTTKAQTSAVETLGKHLVQDAPLLWLRYLLVPLFTRWSQLLQQQQQQQQQQQRRAHMPDESLRTGKATMQRLLDALCTAALQEALRKEKVLADNVLKQVHAFPACTDAGTQSAYLEEKANEKRKAVRLDLRELQHRQRQHVGEVLCLTGTLARTTQSFSVISTGGLTLLFIFVVRLMGHARASWAEWSRTRTAEEVSRAGPLRSMMSRVLDPQVRASDAQHEAKTSVRPTPQGHQRKRRREEEEGEEGKPSPQNSEHTSTHDTLASLRCLLASAARTHAVQLWRSWAVLFGFYGTDLYTDDAVVRRLAQEEQESAGVHRMSATQQAHWRGLRLQAAVRQHTVSETHWVLCQSLVACGEAAVEKLLEGEHSRDGSSAVLYRRVVAATLRVFFQEVRDTLRAHGTATLALRSGGLPGSAEATVPATLQSVVYNTVALQRIFQDTLAQSLRLSDDHDDDKDHVKDGDEVKDPAAAAAAAAAPLTSHSSYSSFGTQAGAYLWQLLPTLLRTQAPDEASWMSSGSTALDFASSAAATGDDDEAAVAHFADVNAACWRGRAAQLSTVLADASTRMETVLAGADAIASPDSAAQRKEKKNKKRKNKKKQQRVEYGDDADGFGGYRRLVELFMKVVYDDVVRRPAAAKTRPAAALNGIATLFPSVFDASCFFALQPERQRLFTRSLQRLCELVRGSSVAGDTAFLSAVQGDTRLWMLLAYGVVLQCERRGRTAHEDEALLVSGLLPLLSRMGVDSTSSFTSDNGGDAVKECDDLASPSDTGGATNTMSWLAWADLPTTQDMLLLLASGLTALPWSTEEMYMAVERHTTLCTLYGQPTPRCTTPSADPSAFAAAAAATAASARETLRDSVIFLSQWFAVDEGERGNSGAAMHRSCCASSSSSSAQRARCSATASAAELSMWDLSDAPLPPQNTAHASKAGGVAALMAMRTQVDQRTRQHAPFQRHSLARTRANGASAGRENFGAIDRVAADDDVDEDDDDDEEAIAERQISAALGRHARAAAPFTSSAPCALLIIVSAYRTLSRALYGLRGVMADQQRIAREEDVRVQVGRSVAYCTTEDVGHFRSLLAVVHQLVFGQRCQPHGLLRLWLGYLQHLFLCVVPHASSLTSREEGGGDGSGEEGRLVLMSKSWQHRCRVTSLFGARVYRTGWRALQHDGEAASHIRLRVVLGEALGDLFLLPYQSAAEDSDVRQQEGTGAPSPPSASSTSCAASLSVLQHLLPHALLDILCELLAIPTGAEREPANVHRSSSGGGRSATASAIQREEEEEEAAAAAATGRGIRQSFLGLAGLLAFLRRLETFIVPGSLQDRRLEAVLRRVYDAADAAALGV